jgi:predicted TIM-barrel fold metal-dependent hydrolase
MILDCHTHVYPAGSAGFWKKASSVDDLLAAMDRASVARAAVVAIAPHISTEQASQAASRAPDRLVAIGSVDPREPSAPAEAARAVRDLGVRAIKIHPRLQSFGAREVPMLVPLAEQCGSLGVPLMICSFQGGADMFRARILEMCADLAAAVPAATFLLAHAGGYQPMEALLLMKAYRNIWLDLSFSPLYFRDSSVIPDFEYLVRRGDRRRLLFGSDFPEAPIDESVAYIDGLLTRLSVSSADRDAIMGENALGLLRA